MEEDEHPTNNWLTVLRRKIQKKFKRNRQKIETSAGLIDILECETTEIVPATENSTTNTATNQLSQLTPQDCEEMKKELFKLAWYWPNLNRVDSQKILSNKPNGSFLIRDSSEKDSFTLSFRTNSKTFHCRNQW